MLDVSRPLGDQIAMRLGIEKTAMIRARAGISYALAEAMDEGHCGPPVDELRELAAALLEIATEVVDAAIALERAEGAVIADTDRNGKSWPWP